MIPTSPVLFLCVSVVSGSSAFAQREFGFDNTKPSGQPYLKPEETVRRMKIADGFEIHLAAAEPTIVNPIAFTVDEKGRLWCVECFEYPKRTPKGKMPRDRIVILESTKGDGVFDKRTVFAEGKDFPMSFDMASGIEVGHGGVFLGAPPYLWFIENKNDKPGKFEVLLKGFGSQDTHETLNTFQWGPDGWLYGLHGVFTNSEVTPGNLSGGRQPPDGSKNQPPDRQKNQGADAPRSGVKLNAGVWRYHPKTRKFEIFAEGTSNPWGMDWRNTDGEFILCCCVIPHLYHMVPGGIYRRQAGASFNPYAYGEIKEICDHTFHRESGWAHAGLISLDVPHIPEKWRNSVIFGSIHGCSVKQNILERKGSTFVAHRGDDFLVSGDKNFRPINMKWGPSGEIYLIDWHDQNPCHQTKPDDWDYEHGRIYRIQVKGTKIKKAEDLAALNDEALLGKLNDANPYVGRQALRLAYERFAGRPAPFVNTPKIQHWEDLRSLHALGAELKFDPGVVRGDASTAIAWLARFAADRLNPTGAEIAAMASVVVPWPDALLGTSPVARREYASAAVRLAGRYDVRHLLHQLMWTPEDANDPLIPHLVWLAYEKTLANASDAVLDAELKWLVEESYPKVLTPERVVVNYMVMDYMLPRVMRRLASGGRPQDLVRCLAAVEKMTDAYVRVRRKALAGLAEALKDRLVDAPKNWPAVRGTILKDADAETRRFVKLLEVSFRDPAATQQALAIAADAAKAMPERIDAVRALAMLRPDGGLGVLLKLTKEGDLALQTEAVRALAGYADSAVAKELLASWAKLSPAARADAANVLAGRREWARELLNALAAKKVAPQDVPDNAILRIRAFNDRGLNDMVEKSWGRFRATPKELDALIAKMRTSLSEGPASFERGRKVFDTHCAKCHKFEGRGAEVGPQLDGAARDIEYLLGNILDPNRVIGAPYFVHVIERKNGTSEAGLLVGEDGQSITLKIEQGVQKVIPKAEIETHTIQEKSLMPEGLTAGMTAQEFRDLLRYVMANPFINHVTLDGKALTVGTPGRIPLPKDAGSAAIVAEVTAPAAMKTRLQLGSRAELAVTLNGKSVYHDTPGEDRPDAASVEVELKAGVNRLEVVAKYNGSGALFARFLDPDRKLKYPEPK